MNTVEIMELNHVALHVRDVEASVAFDKKLGFPQIPRPNFSFPGAWFLLGERQELHLIGELAEDVDVHSLPRGNHFALQIPNMEAALAFLKEKGIAHNPPKFRPDGMKQVFIPDPDGYFLELTELSAE